MQNSIQKVNFNAPQKSNFNFTKSPTDLTVITNLMKADGIGRQGLGLIQALKNDYSINVVKVPPIKYDEISPEIMSILNKPITQLGNVAILTYIIGTNPSGSIFHQGLKSPIKYAYSMFESDSLPSFWVQTINEYYDGVIVPDSWLVKSYEKAGVKAPIFVVPLGIMIENLLQQPLRTQPHEVFTFGMTSGFWERKNQIKAIDCFAEAFGNNTKVKFKIHGRFGSYQQTVENHVKKLNLSNLEFYSGPMTSIQYDQFLDSLDCMVFISKGEGYSITPREMLALGRPVILSNNTAHKTICKTGFVHAIDSHIRQPARYEIFQNQQIGNYFDCNQADVVDMMKKIYYDYAGALLISRGGREWVKKALWSNLKPLYQTLVKPQKVILTKSNYVSDEILGTTSQHLVRKYEKFVL